MNYKKALIILLGVLLIYVTPAFAQTPTTLQGSAVSETGEKPYTLVLQSAADSSIVAVEVFSETVFRFSGLKPQTYLLRVQDVQYEPYDTLITVVEGENVLKTPLALKPKTLGEVVVRGSRPVLKYDHGNITVDVANSYLKDDINLVSILGKLPGIIVDEKGSIKMFGKSKLLIYVDHAKVGAVVLRLLQPIDIDKIEIIRNVGAEYEADVDAVIRIRTKKRREEKLHLAVNNELDIRHYLSNNLNLRLYLGGNDKISQYITLDNGFDKFRDVHRSYLYTYQDNYTHLNLRDDYSVSNRKSAGLRYFLNWSLSRDREFGVQYSGRVSDSHKHIAGARIYDNETTSQTVDIDSRDKHKDNSSILNLHYIQKVGNVGELSVIADGMIANDDNTTDIKESTADRSTNNIIDSDNGGKVFSITPEYKVTGKKLKYSTGLKYSYLDSKSATTFHSLTDVINISEHLTGAYATFDASLSFVSIKSGIRAEYTQSGIRYDDGQDDLNRNYFNIVPHISLNGKPNRHINLTTYYRRRLQRPYIGYLSSTVRYRDSLLYSTGNPRLKPAMTDVFGFNAGLYKFDFSLEYSVFKNRVINEDMPDSENPDRTINTYINMKEKFSALNLTVSYSFSHPVFSNMTSLSCGKQFNLSVPFGDEIIKFNKPRYQFQTSGNVKILKNTSLDYSFAYHGTGHSSTVRYDKPYSNLRLTLSQYAMNRKLLFSLQIIDVFNKSKPNRWTQYSNGNILYTQDSDQLDSRYVIFRIRYSWGKSKSIQTKRSDTDHLGRL